MEGTEKRKGHPQLYSKGDWIYIISHWPKFSHILTLISRMTKTHNIYSSQPCATQEVHSLRRNGEEILNIDMDNQHKMNVFYKA